jgi:hypothetical protein
MQTGPAAVPPSDTSEWSRRWVIPCGRWTVSPRRAHAAAASAPATPTLETIATVRPRGTGWVASRAATSANSLSPGVTINPGLLEQLLAAGERRVGRPGLHGQHRHLVRDPARGAGELARVAERLDVQDSEPGDAVVLPPQQHVVARDVELAADGGERGDADAEPGQLAPPDCITSPAAPRSGWLAANVASSPAPGTEMPKEPGPASRMP